MIERALERVHPVRGWPVWARYLASVGVVLACFALRWALRGEAAGSPYLFFIPAIIIAGFVFDRGSSVLATLLGAALGLFFFVEPFQSFAIVTREQLLLFFGFILIGLLLSAIIEALVVTVGKLRASNRALEAARDRRAESSALLDALLDSTTDLIYIKDRRGSFVRVNDSSARLLGAPVAVVTGRRDRDFLAPAEADAVERVDEEVMSTGKTHSVEEAISPPGDAPHVYLSTKSPWRNADGEVIGLIGISRDISDRRRAEDALRTSDAQRQLLLADINHRVKNHLQSVAGLLDIAARRTETLAEAQAALEAGAARLGVLGRVYTRLHPSGNATVIGMKGFIEALCADLKSGLADLSVIAVRVEAADVELDSNRAVLVGLIINELVQNALKYAFPDDRAGTVCVFFQRVGDSFHLAVHDDGIGMSVDGRRGSGTRLVRALSQQLGGSIAWSGPPGTDIVIVFPAADPATRL